MKFFISHYLVFGLALFTLSFADLPEKQLQDSIDSKLESMESRRGLEIGGTVRSVMLRSAFSSKQDINAYDISPDNERSGFSQFDLKIGVRPFDAARANVVLRMSANYQDYFQIVKTMVSVPWISMEGQVSDWLFWTVGDFRSELSPLSIYSPDVEVLYEPEIYARNRYMARDQVFLKGNMRNLQGANIQTRLNLGETLGEIRIEGIFSRLRRAEVLDFGGYMGNILPNQDSIPGASQASGMDKLLYAGNLEWLPVSKNLLIGLTPIFIKDLKSSSTSVWRVRQDKYGDNLRPAIETVNPSVLGPENAQIITARIGADAAGFLNNENLIANLVGEYAMSKDDYYNLSKDEDGTKFTKLTELEGSAILAQLTVGWQAKDSWLAKLSMDYLMNDSAWYNPLAQSPAFFARRIANSDNDGNLLKYGARSPFYSTFDALYHFVPKFMPVDSVLSVGGSGSNLYKPTESYHIAPFSKNSYSATVYTRDELALLQYLIDPVLQSALPNGLATANRVGPRLNLTAGFGKENEIEVQGLFAALEQSEAVGGEKAAFSEFGGGAKADVGAVMWGLPLELSGSYKNSKSEIGSIEFASDFVNAGLYAKFYKRFGFSAGFQQISTDAKDDAYQSEHWYLSKGNQKQWMIGLDYTLAKNAWVALNFGQIIVDNTYKTGNPEKAWDDVYLPTSEKEWNNTTYLPIYIVKHSKDDKYPSFRKLNEIKHSFQQNLVEASINVDF